MFNRPYWDKKENKNGKEKNKQWRPDLQSLFKV